MEVFPSNFNHKYLFAQVKHLVLCKANHNVLNTFEPVALPHVSAPLLYLCIASQVLNLHSVCITEKVVLY